MSELTTPKHPAASLTIWGVALMILSKWWPDAAAIASDPSFWSGIKGSFDMLLGSLGAFMSAFGLRRVVGGGLTGFFR